MAGARADLPAGQQPAGGSNSSSKTAARAGIVESGEAGPRGGDQLDADEIAGRVQAIIDDPTREADEQDDRILQALYARREAEAQPAAAGDDVAEFDGQRPAAGNRRAGYLRPMDRRDYRPGRAAAGSAGRARPRAQRRAIAPPIASLAAAVDEQEICGGGDLGRPRSITLSGGHARQKEAP